MSLKHLYPLLLLAVGFTFALSLATAHVQMPRGLRLLPTAVEDHASKVFSGVSPQARSWILDQARAASRQPHINVEAIHNAAIQRFSSKIKLTKSQQDELALAVLGMVMKLDESEYQKLADKASPQAAAAANKASPKNTSAELQAIRAEINEAQALAESALRRIGDSRDSIVGKL
jgi:hypothetical protein